MNKMQTLAIDMYRIANEIPTKFRKMFLTFAEKKAINENIRIFSENHLVTRCIIVSVICVIGL